MVLTSPRAIASPPPGSLGHLGGGMVRCVAASLTQPPAGADDEQ